MLSRIKEFFATGSANYYNVSEALCLADSKVMEMMRESKNKADFDKLALTRLKFSNEDDPFNYSLMMGKFFGVYNLYNNEFISDDVRNSLVSFEPNLMTSVAFLNKNNDSIKNFMMDKFSMSELGYDKLLKTVFEINNNYSNCSKEVTCFSKIFMGGVLYNNMDEFPGCDVCINCFNEKNNSKIKVSNR